MKIAHRSVQEQLPYRLLAAAALVSAVALMLGLLALVLLSAGWGFWPKPLELFQLKGGETVLGEKWGEEKDPQGQGVRWRIKVGNRDLWGNDFRLLAKTEVVSISRPSDAWLLERLEYGNFYGFPQSLVLGDREEPATVPGFFKLVQDELERMGKLRRETKRLTKQLGLSGVAQEEELRKLEELQKALEGCVLVMVASDGHQHQVPCSQIVHAWPMNQIGFLERLGVFARRWVEFLGEEPRESNTEGGIFPALFGTALMVLLMTVGVVPLGVLTGVYLREYAPDNRITRLVRLAVSTLAGIPSIVFGAFGLAFFVYTVGGTIDRVFFSDQLPTPTFGTGGILWASLTLALLTLPVVVLATEEGLSAAPMAMREAVRALGATRWETLRYIVLPYAKPGIFTGVILAVARAAGEVAPLMLTGVVKLAPTMPLDSTPPFFHLERKFMHLGFHIYDVGFQSPNVEAARPVVFATTLVLLLLVLLLNALALHLRNKARSQVRFQGI